MNAVCFIKREEWFVSKSSCPVNYVHTNTDLQGMSSDRRVHLLIGKFGYIEGSSKQHSGLQSDQISNRKHFPVKQ